MVILGVAPQKSYLFRAESPFGVVPACKVTGNSKGNGQGSR